MFWTEIFPSSLPYFLRETYIFHVDIPNQMSCEYSIFSLNNGVQLGPPGTATTNGLLCQPRVIMMMEKLVEWLAGEAELLGGNLTQCSFVHHKPHMLPGRDPGPPRWEASI
jgi:hypothetical protein